MILKKRAEVKVWNTQRVLEFADANDVVKWAEAELERWGAVNAPKDARLLKNYRAQQQVYSGIISSARASDENTDFNVLLRPVSDGSLVTTESEYFPAILSLASKNADSAALLRMMARSDPQARMQEIQAQYPLSLALGFLSDLAISTLGASDRIDENDRHEVERVKNILDAAVADARIKSEEINSLHKKIDNDYSVSKRKRADDWDGEMGRIKDEWVQLKSVYDTELGLRAPTTYWTDRAKSHRNQSIYFGTAFSVALIAFFLVFAGSGLSYLQGVPENKSAVLAVLPILIPVFAGIWVLRILGRLLSENLLLMRDARERETLVKTFLALMKDESTGKSVVKDEDRILILHSLFRPASINAADDAPPVHWFDILANKVGGKK
jgi:hypothetical protein